VDENFRGIPKAAHAEMKVPSSVTMASQALGCFFQEINISSIVVLWHQYLETENVSKYVQAQKERAL
jgi:hypothetical protein